MSAPRPDEITTALDTLRRVPGVADDTRLSRVPELASPLIQFGIELRRWISRGVTPDVGQLISTLETMAAAHGLRITTDPELGELIHYQVLHPGPFNPPEWKISRTQHAVEYPPTLKGLADIESHIDFGERIAAVYLLPEGGQK
ncbi:hypothetical protein [Nocardia sp. NPDC060249]|uniref:hypothetical protein n=1 Tax=Nocardia sp. NPDC060249 TaxID=3347082 RepID=UPI003655D57C